MVTVPLSDLQSNPDESMEETVDEILADSKPSDRSPEETETHPDTMEEKADDIVDGVDEKGDATDCRPESVVLSIAASQNNEDETKSLHSAAGSDSVDWDELDKTEEQEPRTEATDEVSLT